jgi:NADP-dependent 3-hydroxy acid dehydrogenase YdfG
LKQREEALLKAKKAVVSGGAQGIGKALATSLCSAGVFTSVADLVSTDLPESMAEKSAWYACDVTLGRDVEKLYVSLREAGNLPDILICSAGRGIHEKLTEGDPEKWKAVLDLNVMGALRLVRAFVPDMLAAGAGDVVFISSVAAGQAYPYGGVYAASKAALETIAETLRLETLPTIRVIVVSPGVTRTSFFDHTVSGHQTVESIGYGALEAEDVAEAVIYALTCPPGVAINHVAVRPRGQPF